MDGMGYEIIMLELHFLFECSSPGCSNLTCHVRCSSDTLYHQCPSCKQVHFYLLPKTWDDCAWVSRFAIVYVLVKTSLTLIYRQRSWLLEAIGYLKVSNILVWQELKTSPLLVSHIKFYTSLMLAAVGFEPKWLGQVIGGQREQNHCNAPENLRCDTQT